jgi:LPPG:FO 2-phospho-L-lactate transferase
LKTSSNIVAIAGGVGGAKLARGLASVASRSLTIVVNVGDDFEHLGLFICPDIDSILYGLSGRDDPVRGWGRRDETWNCLASLHEIDPRATWFKLGDRDLAVHIARTRRIRDGERLSDITQDFARAFGIEARVVPVTDDQLRTVVLSDEREIPFQQYFVAEQCKPNVRGFRFEGAHRARLTTQIMNVLEQEIGAVVLCPSNPFVSVDPVLSVPGFKRLLQQSRAPIIAVSPIVGGAALKGPAAKMLQEMGLECSAYGVAKYYRGLIDGVVIDESDERLASSIRELGIDVAVEATIMKTDDDKANLARKTLAFAERIAPRKNSV